MARYTVGSLIAALQELPSHLEVSFHDSDSGYSTFDIDLIPDPEADALYIQDEV